MGVSGLPHGAAGSAAGQMKDCAVIGIQLILLALELVALRCIACNACR